MKIPCLIKRSLRYLAYALVVGLIVWIVRFDSHNLIDRWNWHQEYAQLVDQNEHLREEIEQMQTQLEQPPPDSVIERIAREEYGMHLPGETIYRFRQAPGEE